MRNSLVILMMLAMGTACMNVMQTTNKNALAGVEAACTVVANSYPYYRDQLDYRAYGDLFTEDAVFDLTDYSAKVGKIFGRDAIVAALEARGPTVRTRHLNQVVHMNAIDMNRVSGVSYLILFSAGAGNSNPTPAVPAVVAEYHDKFKVEDGVCRIAERTLRIVF